MAKKDSDIVIRHLMEEDVPKVRDLCQRVQHESARNEFFVHLRRYLSSRYVITTPAFLFCLFHFFLQMGALQSLKSSIQSAIICEAVRFFFFWQKIKGVFGEGEDLKDPFLYYHKPARFFLVAVVDGEIAGTVAVRETEEPNVAKLLRMFVHPSFRRRGIALRLIDASHDECRKLKYQSVSLRTHTTNEKALSCYEKAGYAIVGKRNFASVYPHSFDTIHFVKDLHGDKTTNG
ncbi:uncharacterized protein LOC135224208 [Macrobrachium nipponense]|uniref:uncharacterized protein LOC135224208 n=1 Tax=Macrobrachium nipponense TaxID=159736 RepID=UPI0030C84646